MKINKPSRKKIIILISVIIVAVCGYGAYASSAKVWPFSPTPEEQAAERTNLYGSSETNPDSDTPPSASEDSSSNSGSISSPKDSDDSTGPAIDSSVTPQKPSGTFVSNHHPNLSGNPAPNSMSSTCTTTPGVTCQIQFTMDGVVKKLPAKTTNANGNVSWEWKLQDIHLGVGDWKVTAVASNGNKLNKVSDPMLLSVQE